MNNKGIAPYARWLSLVSHLADTLHPFCSHAGFPGFFGLEQVVCDLPDDGEVGRGVVLFPLASKSSFMVSFINCELSRQPPKPIFAEMNNVQDRQEIFSKLRERIRGYATSIVGADRAEDVAQETVIVLVEKYESVETLTELLRIAFKVARFKIGNLIRLEGRRKTGGLEDEQWEQIQDTPEREPEDEAIRREQISQLAEAIRSLSKKCQEIFRMKLEGHNFADIAEALRAGSVDTLYVWDHRCRRKLKEVLGQHYGWKT